MNNTLLLFPILVPAVTAICVFLLPKTDKIVMTVFTLFATALNLAITIYFMGKTAVFELPWAGMGMDFSLRLYRFSAFILLASAGFAFLVSLYSASAMRGKQRLRLYFGGLLLTLAFVNGAVLANNLVVMLFFWEGLLVMLYMMIMSGGIGANPTAMKALILNGVADLCLLLGVGMYAFSPSGTLAMDKGPIALSGGLPIAAFVLMMIGASAKAGAMPFHSWIPDAAVDAPTPFMAFLPASLEKLLGIYLLARISLDLFKLEAGSALSIVMMTLGVVTILLAVLMALIQKDYKRLLSYHAISQVGYMVLGIGTALPVGIAGGIFHMINHAMYKSGLFLTAGSVEKQTGTTDLKQLGGLGKKMPVTFACFLVTAAAISGVPPFNGFFSKELVFDAALEINWIFYAGALLGAVLTAASFLKLGHAAYFGKKTEAAEKAKEAPWPMLVPMVVIAGFCVLFGLWNTLPLNGIIGPVISEAGKSIEEFTGLPQNWLLVLASMLALALAVLNHWFGVKKSGSGLGAADHIHNAPVLRQTYDLAEKRLLDPYVIGMEAARGTSKVLFWIDRGIDWFYEKCVTGIAKAFSWLVRKPHTGAPWLYVLYTLAGAAIVGAIVLWH